MNSRLFTGVFAGLIATALTAQEPRGWKQPLLQPTLPPKVVGSGRAPEWKMPLIHPILPPTIAGKALVQQHHGLFVPQQGTNGLRMTMTNFVVIVPGPNGSHEEYVRNWDPHLMYPTYPPKLASIGGAGLLESR